MDNFPNTIADPNDSKRWVDVTTEVSEEGKIIRLELQSNQWKESLGLRPYEFGCGFIHNWVVKNAAGAAGNLPFADDILEQLRNWFETTQGQIYFLPIRATITA